MSTFEIEPNDNDNNSNSKRHQYTPDSLIGNENNDIGDITNKIDSSEGKGFKMGDIRKVVHKHRKKLYPVAYIYIV